jgi:anti-anti-sigma regulatory factor
VQQLTAGEARASERKGGRAARRSFLPNERRLIEAAARLAKEGAEVTVNCRELEELGGSPLRVLLVLAGELDRRGVSLTLNDAAPMLARIIALAGIRPEHLER